MTSLLFSCEAATCVVPEQHRVLFSKDTDRLSSAEGWEPGALNLAQGFAMKFRTPLVDSQVSRLLIDVSRTPGDPARWSDIAGRLTDAHREQLHDRHFAPYLETLRQRIEDGGKRNSRVLHLSLRTDPEENGPDVAVVFDPLRTAERGFADRWIEELRESAPDLRISANDPDDGSAHGLLRQLRREFPDPGYAAVTLSVAQSFFLRGHPWRWDKAKKLMLETFARAVEATEPEDAA